MQKMRKGKSTLGTGYVYAPYIPLFVRPKDDLIAYLLKYGFRRKSDDGYIKYWKGYTIKVLFFDVDYFHVTLHYTDNPFSGRTWRYLHSEWKECFRTINEELREENNAH